MITLPLFLFACGSEPAADPCSGGPTPDVHSLPVSFDVVSDEVSVGTLTVPATGPVVFAPKTAEPSPAAVAFAKDLSSYAASPSVDLMWDAGSFENGVRAHYQCNRSVERSDSQYAGAVERRATRRVDGHSFELTVVSAAPTP